MTSNGGASAPSFLDRLTAIHGRLSDLKAVWFPFIRLKPEPHQIITPARRIAMTFCFGLYGAGIWVIWRTITQTPATGRDLGIVTLKSCAFFAIWFRLVTVPLWNRRARHL